MAVGVGGTRAHRAAAVVRRRFPLTSFWIIVVAASQIYDAPGVDLTWTIVALMVAAYSAPTYSRYRNLALVSVVAAAVALIAGGGDDLPNLPSRPHDLPVAVDRGVGGERDPHLAATGADPAREQEAATRLALEHERARLARELHDVVGHNVSVMVIQAGAARKVPIDHVPRAEAREALLAVEAGGRAAMTELRQVIDCSLWTVTWPTWRPSPGSTNWPIWSSGSARPASRDADLTGTFAALPAGVELAAYRWCRRR
jgi:signal transduction histidine kinase